MNTRVFNNGYVGIKLNSVSEIMKYNALRDSFSICNESEYYFDEYVEVIHENGEVTEREPTENEKLERILQAFNNGDTLYATFWLDCGEVFPTSETTLQSDFRVGQDVFFMKNNKICSKKIFRIMLNKVADYGSCVDHTSIVERLQGDEIKMQHEHGNLYWIGTCEEYTSIHNERCNRYNKFEIKRESEIFSSKEELVKYLMEGKQ